MECHEVLIPLCEAVLVSVTMMEEKEDVRIIAEGGERFWFEGCWKGWGGGGGCHDRRVEAGRLR